MTAIRYQSQRLSMRFFMLMAVLFIIQVVFGIILAMQENDPLFLQGVMDFNITRAEHLDLGIDWILSGFIGSIVFVAPLLSRREFKSPWLIKFLFYALLVIVIGNMGTQYLAHFGIAGWWLDQPWFQQGREYLEEGRIVQILLLVGFAVLTYVVMRMFPKRRDWNEIHWGLVLGLLGLTIVWIFGMFFVPRLDMSEYFRWYVVHYWVEGVWEIIHISLVGCLIVLMFKAKVKSVGYAVFWGVAMVWLSGLIGNAHHYFWIGTPQFWQFWGSVFSALEPVPLVFCFWHIYLDAHQNRKAIPNTPAFYFLLGSVLLEQVGAGILGFSMTFARTNVWSHGTWITAGHAHLALFGTFGMLGIAVAYWAVPIMRGIKAFDERLGRLGFWLVLIGILGMAFAFNFGGTVEVFHYRTLGLDWFGGAIDPTMRPFRVILLIFGSVLVVGAGIIVYDLLTAGHRIPSAGIDQARREREARYAAGVQRVATGWARYLTGYEVGLWLLGLWFFGAVITVSLLSFNLAVVQAGHPTLPYVLAGVGYAGLLLVTLLFIWRFLASVRSREWDAAAPALRPHGEEPEAELA